MDMTKYNNDPFGFNKAINFDKLDDPKVLSELSKIFGIEEKTDYPLTDSEFMDIDDKLYIIIQKTLGISYNINEDKHLHNWYCDIRNKLCQQIQDKKLELKK